MLPLILASASPRRRRLLQQAGYDFRVVAANVSEIAPQHLSPGEITLFNARSKAHAIARRHPQALVIGVDTLVALEGEVFGKPPSMEAAFNMLQRLNGRTHEVVSGVWLCHAAGRRERGFIDVTQVRFRRLNDEELRGYLRRIDPLDKAGAYAAQDDRGELIAKCDGSLSNVVGLPMEAFAEALREFGG